MLGSLISDFFFNFGSCEDDVFPTCESTEFWDEANSPCILSRAKYLYPFLSPNLSTFQDAIQMSCQFLPQLLHSY
jgi:hypothetical protein